MVSYRISNNMAAIVILICSGLIIIDQLLKTIIRNCDPYIAVIKNIFYITFIKNTGVGFGMLRNHISFVISINIIAIIFIIWLIGSVKKSFLADVSLALVLGGAIGNIIDRVVFGYVTDFISFSFWPAFNVADSAVSVGAVMVAYCLLWGKFDKK